ncbi:MAG: ABC transporter ATP-binding protein [Novosphingobium sp.]
MTPVHSGLHTDNVVALDIRHRRPEPPAEPLLSVRNLHVVTAEGRELVRDVSFELPAGGTLGIVGESGSGKSLTCRAILDVLPPGLGIASGSIRFADMDLSRLRPAAWKGLRGTALSAVFQDPGSYLNPSIPVGRQLVEAIRATLRLSRKAARERALDLFRQVGFEDAAVVYRQYPFELSGGMAQRVLIALSICAGPRLLIADEATTALDVTVQAEVLDLIDRLRREQALTLIVVSHDLAVVSQICDHVIVMRDGAVVEAGPTGTVLHDPKSAYTRSLIEDHAVHTIESAGARPALATARPTPLLAVKGLHAGYGIRTVIEDVDLELARGEILGLIGKTGSGKTTLLRTILSLIPVASGTIELDGARIDELKAGPLRELRRSGALQYVFQDPLRSLDPDLTIATSVTEGLSLRGDTDRAAIGRALDEALQAVGLDPELSSRLPRHLSGGQRQRAVIARALALSPKVLLLDEPVSALDAVNRLHVLKLLRSLAQEKGIAQVFISHDLGSVAGIADRVAVLYRGRIVETGPADQVLANPSHPYTRRLLDAAPRLSAQRSEAPAVFTAH